MLQCYSMFEYFEEKVVSRIYVYHTIPSQVYITEEYKSNENPIVVPSHTHHQLLSLPSSPSPSSPTPIKFHHLTHIHNAMAPILNFALALAMPILSMAAALPSGTELENRGTTLTGTVGIVGGTTAALGEFPYIVSLTYAGSHFCGGVLLNAYTVLTAAHCSVSYSASSVKVRAGTLVCSCFPCPYSLR